MNTRFLLIVIPAAVAATLTCDAQLVVEDPAAIAQDAVNQAVNIAQYVAMVNNQIQQISTMSQLLQQTTAYNNAFGNPAQVTNVVGANQVITSFPQPGVGQNLTVLQQSASVAQSLTNNGNGLYQGVSDTALSGITVPRVTTNYAPYGAVENASANYTSVESDVAQKRQALTAQIASTVNQLQAATTDAETQKLQAVLTAQSAQLQALNQQISQAASSTTVQGIANQNEQSKEAQAQNEEVAANRHDALTKFGTMMQPDVTSQLRFGTSSGQ
jgi:hypothetical protein